MRLVGLARSEERMPLEVHVCLQRLLELDTILACKGVFLLIKTKNFMRQDNAATVDKWPKNRVPRRRRRCGGKSAAAFVLSTRLVAREARNRQVTS